MNYIDILYFSLGFSGFSTSDGVKKVSGYLTVAGAAHD